MKFHSKFWLALLTIGINFTPAIASQAWVEPTDYWEETEARDLPYDVYTSQSKASPTTYELYEQPGVVKIGVYGNTTSEKAN